MKYIVKNPEPQDLLDWKAQDSMFKGGNPNYERIAGPIKLLLAASLRFEQGNICCYCERPITETDCHVEHIKPQGIATFKKYSCDYDNMICSCQRDLAKGEPRHCGINKGSWYDQKLFVSPLDPECETKFAYTFDGQIIPADPTEQAVITTIDKCKLAIPKLKSMREGVIDTFTDDTLSDEELTAYVRSYLKEKDSNNGSYNAFYTTIRILFGHLLEKYQ